MRLTPAVRALLVVILLGAALLRFWDFGTTPPGLHYDEAYNGLDALDVLVTGPKLFFEGNTGREPSLNNLLALSVAVFGRESYALRLPAAALGLLTVAATFALARTMFRPLGPGAVRVALIAAALLAVSHWQVDINRLSLRVNTMPLALAVAFFLLWRAARGRPQRLGAWLAAGAAFGLVGYTYISARILPAFAAALGAAEALLRPRDPAWPSAGKTLVGWLRSWRFWPWLGAAAAVVAPLAIFYALHPDLFLGRATYVSALGPSGGSDRLAALGESLLYNLAMFGHEGDWNWRHNLPGKPVFAPPLYALFLLGVAVSLFRLRQGPYLLLLVWTAAMLLPGIVATDEYPHYTRVMGIVPAVFLFPALGAEAIIQGAARLLRRPATSALAAAPFLVLAAWNGAATAHDYFAIWRHEDDVYYAFHAEAADAARLMNRLGDDPDRVFLLPYNFRLAPDFRARTVDFLYTGRAPYHFVRVEEASLPAGLPGLVGTAREAVLFHWKGGDLGDADPKGLTAFLLARGGKKVAEEEHPGFSVRRFQIDRPLPAALFAGERPSEARFGDWLALRGWAAGSEPSDGSLWAVFRWETLARPPGDFSFSLQVTAPDGTPYAQADGPLLSNDLFPTSRWRPGLPAATYVTLDGRPHPPPGEYRLRLVVYELATGRVVGAVDPLGTLAGP
ncbi:MAG: glycosyltransferase family 39 protein [Chloroflexota bacterium]|nr:glycosyltransferase family 39 protein [Dehalococcoidia bacterium]MDW8253831.1 glycosyltransferase family 39 protein [Chloroflexota bacterium]